MKQENYVKGKYGEALAENYLRKQKYKILERNYKNKIGEIDLIAEDKNVLVFVEVKYRTSAQFGLPSEAVNYYKIQKIQKTAILYLQTNKLEDAEIRFDVIDILGEEITHIKNAF